MATAFWTRSLTGKRLPLRFEIKFNSGNDIRKSVALTLQDELKKAWH